MLLETNFEYAQWFKISADKKKANRIALFKHLLNKMKYHIKNENILSEE